MDQLALEVEAARAAGLEPLDYLLGVMRDPNANQHMRMSAAKAAAPYRHSRKPVALQHQNLDAEGKPVGPTLQLIKLSLDSNTGTCWTWGLAEKEPSAG